MNSKLKTRKYPFDPSFDRIGRFASDDTAEEMG
jgi:hypothetical protein